MQLKSNQPQNASLDQSLEYFSGTVILTSDNPYFSQESSLVDLKVVFPALNDKARDLIWLDLEKRLHAEKAIRLHQNASKFLRSPEAKRVNWDGHAINRCFKIAIALATTQSKGQGDGVVIVEETHFKEAMNIEHESRPGGRPLSPPPLPANPVDHPGATPSDASHDEHQVNATNTIRQSVPPDENAVLSPMTEPWFSGLSSDSDYCIAGLNWTGWDTFRAASENSLFRETKFYAIDVLEGEPLIKLQPKDQRWRRPGNLVRKNTIPSASTDTTSGQSRPVATEAERGEATLPERIRINSPAIIKTFAAISNDSMITGPFLLFRPFRSLLYYEPEFHYALSAGQKELQGDPII